MEQQYIQQSETKDALLSRPFPVVAVTRLSLVEAGLSEDLALSLTDEEVTRIAQNMAEGCDPHTLRESLRIATNNVLEEKLFQHI